MLDAGCYSTCGSHHLTSVTGNLCPDTFNLCTYSMAQEKATIWSATPTPFLDDGSLDDVGIERLTDQHIQLGVSGLMLGGTSGEGPFMLASQLPKLVSMVKRHAGSRLSIAVQVSDTSAARVIDNMRQLADTGADYYVIGPPNVILPVCCKRDFVRRYFLESMEKSTLPVGLYVREPPAKIPLDLSLWLEFASHPKVELVKDSSGSTQYQDALAQLGNSHPQLRVLTGNEFNVIPAVAAGYSGGLMGTGILNGRLIGEGLNALAEGDRSAADLWQARSNRFLHDLFREDISCWMSGLKYALKELGVFSTCFSHFSFPFDDADRKRIRAALEREKAFLVSS